MAARGHPRGRPDARALSRRHADANGLRLDIDAEEGGTRPRLQEIPGLVPRLTQPIVGCAFAARCDLATDRCRTTAPPVVDAGGGHTVACWETGL